MRRLFTRWDFLLCVEELQTDAVFLMRITIYYKNDPVWLPRGHRRLWKRRTSNVVTLLANGMSRIDCTFDGVNDAGEKGDHQGNVFDDYCTRFSQAWGFRGDHENPNRARLD